MTNSFLSLFLILFFCANIATAQNKSDTSRGYRFTPVIDLKTTSVKDQNRSSTCWAFAGLSFLESELERMGKPITDLSEMFVVYNTYCAKADKYVRMHGNTNFSPGGAFHDVTWVMKKFGLMPEEAYPGLAIGEKKPVHIEMDEALKDFVSSIIKNKNNKLSPVWNSAFKNILDNYLGKVPEEFVYKGKTYSPKTFVSDYLKIDPNDYIEIGSFTHHPFYKPFIIEIPDNWLWDEIYNVPLADMMYIIDHALENGYTIAWGADVSDKGFATKTKGVAVVPDLDFSDMTNAEIKKWEKMSEKQKEDEFFKIEKPSKEKEITQEMRQIDFDNYTSTDDHGMHIVGTAKDQNGTEYYKVKNSWGNYNDYDGYFYASKPYVALRTIDIMIHKDALPKRIAKQLGL